MARPLTLHVPDAVADSVERHPEIARLAERFVEEQVALLTWREGRFSGEVQELVRRSFLASPEQNQDGSVTGSAAVTRLIGLLEKAEAHYLESGA